MTNRIDIISQNGNDGRVYLVERVARIICGEHPDQPLMGQSAGKKRWELHVPTAIKVLEELGL